MREPPAATTVAASPRVLSIGWPDGRVSEYPSLWLRDNRPADRDPFNGQRWVDLADLPHDPRIHAARLQSDAVAVEWEGETEATLFALSWLAQHIPGTVPNSPELTVRRWLHGADLDAQRDFAWTGPTSDRAARLAWLTRLLQDGIAFMGNLPREESTLLDVCKDWGSVLETNYGRVFDVRSVPQPENLAYSDLGLGLHTDNPYREPVPGFQVLHVLAASPDGGDSLFADGFAIAEHLRAVDPDTFKVLTRTPVPFLYRSKDVELYAQRPFIQLSCDGVVSAVHYNSRSIAPLRLAPAEMAPFYAAYRVFANLLRETRFQLKLRLAAGELVAFDNRRVLHGRTAFSSTRSLRHLRGCYLTRDSVYSCAALLRRSSTS